MRQLYIQTLHARGRPRHLPPTQPEQTQPEQTQPEQTQQQRRHALQTLQGERPPLSEDAQQQQSMQEDQQQPQQPQEQQQQQPQYPLRDNGLMLVQLYPTSPSTPTPASSMTSEGAADGGASHSASSLSTLSRANGLLEERYREFSDSTQRGRAAMRNALAANLHIEEDHQVLLTGEVSRRRRRRVHGRFSHPSESPDIASDNSSAIISQLQQQQPQHEHTQLNEQDQTQARSTVLDQIPLESFETPLSEPVVENALDSQHVSEDSTEMGGNAGSLVAPSEDSQTTTTAPSVPVVSVELASGSDGNNTGGASLQGNSDGGSGGNLDSRTNTEGPAQGSTHPQHSVPLTPPSPNPNRNPMPTFTDRRRSSINPADIEAVVREMEANVQSEMARIASRALPFSTTFGSRGGSLLTRTAALDSSHDDTATVEETETSRRESQPPLPASGQVGQRDAQPLPSPPQTEPESGVVSGEIESPSLH
ncbi:hypothetical protein BGZ58_000763 [Dissophora ornata]|nr:hypothetical protein BGZ58_000763 [Dissophora ornata]